MGIGRKGHRGQRSTTQRKDAGDVWDPGESLMSNNLLNQEGGSLIRKSIAALI